MNHAIHFWTSNENSYSWIKIKSVLISAINSEKKSREVNVQIVDNSYSSRRGDFNIIMGGGEEIPDLNPKITFCILPSTKKIPGHLKEYPFAGVTTPKLLRVGPKVILGHKDVFDELPIELDIFQSPKLKSFHNFFKATIMDRTSYEYFAAKYILEYMSSALGYFKDDKS